MNDAYFKEKAACCMTEDKIERNLFSSFCDTLLFNIIIHPTGESNLW